MEQLQSNEKTNLGRQLELDLARGLAVVFMVAVHGLEAFSNQQVITSRYGSLVSFLGGPPAAPVFMFLLGVGIIYSNKSLPSILLQRGGILVLSGYLLNFFRGSLPNLLGYAYTYEDHYLVDALNELIAVDILQFAGLTLMFFAFIKQWKVKNLTVIFIGLTLAFANFSIRTLEFDSFIARVLSSLVWGSSYTSYFPFFSWIPYPIAGYFFGMLLINSNNKVKLYTLVLVLGFIGFLLFGYVIVGIWDRDIGFYDEYAYYHQDLFGNLVFLSFVFGWLGFLFFTSRAFFGPIKQTLERWSKHVTPMFWIHWVFIGFLSMILEPNSLNRYESLLLTIFLILVSDLLSQGYVRLKKTKAIMR